MSAVASGPLLDSNPFSPRPASSSPNWSYSPQQRKSTTSSPTPSSPKPLHSPIIGNFRRSGSTTSSNSTLSTLRNSIKFKHDSVSSSDDAATLRTQGEPQFERTSNDATPTAVDEDDDDDRLFATKIHNSATTNRTKTSPKFRIRRKMADTEKEEAINLVSKLTFIGITLETA